MAGKRSTAQIEKTSLSVDGSAGKECGWLDLMMVASETFQQMQQTPTGGRVGVDA
jgi:ABC-type uncharacterized transport system YnjBCD substrate-binding protein